MLQIQAEYEGDTLDNELSDSFNQNADTSISDEKYQQLSNENEKLKKRIQEMENSMLNQLEDELRKKGSDLKTSQEDMVRTQKRLEIFEKQNKDLKSEIDKLK